MAGLGSFPLVPSFPAFFQEARTLTLLTEIRKTNEISLKTHSTTSSEKRVLIKDDYDY